MSDESADKSPSDAAAENPEQPVADTGQDNQAVTGASPADSPAPAEAVEETASPAEAAPADQEVAQPRQNIKIGSRQERPGKKPAPGSPAATGKTTARPTGPTAIPTVRDPLPADLEQEIQAALGNTDLDEIVASEVTQQASELLADDSTRRATVIRVHGDDVFFSLSGPHEGTASIRQFKKEPTIGDQLDVIIKRYNSEDSLYEVRLPGAAVDVSDWSDLQDGAVVEARITGANTGGLECMVNNIRGFIPASQIGVFRVENFAEYIDQKLPCVVTEVNRRRKNLVLSHRAVLERDAESNRKEVLKTLQVGQTIEGTVRNIRDFGVFVDIGGIDGMIHISQLSWDRVEHPENVVTKGETVKVRIEKINLQTGKIGLSYRALQEHPWTKAAEQFPTGTTVEGTVSRIADFGAFVRLAAGVEGLIHVSELAHHRVSMVSSVVNEGDQVSVKVLSVDADAQRMSLSLKALQDAPAGTQKGKASQEDDTPAWERTVPQRKAPLKGGMDRPSGGEQFGLKW
ncbi:MAG: S1 RNA-binding domain-containing protein [Pirellulaceae bacterium]